LKVKGGADTDAPAEVLNTQQSLHGGDVHYPDRKNEIETDVQVSRQSRRD
jgi:hypothetical protein